MLREYKTTMYFRGRRYIIKNIPQKFFPIFFKIIAFFLQMEGVGGRIPLYNKAENRYVFMKSLSFFSPESPVSAHILSEKSLLDSTVFI